MNQGIFLWMAVGTLTALLAGYFSHRSQKKYKLPPIVPGIPVMGNALQVPPSQQGQWAKSLAEKYGEM